MASGGGRVLWPIFPIARESATPQIVNWAIRIASVAQVPNLSSRLIVGGSAISPSLVALKIQAIARDLQEAYENLLDALVFCHSFEDRKTALKFQKVLRDYRSYDVLQLIWIESPHVTDDDLQSLGIDRNFAGRHLTCWGLATQIAEKGDFGKVHKQISVIVKAGLAYGLIEGQTIRSKKIALVGTRLLHQFVIDLSQTSAGIFARGLGLRSLWDISF